MIYKRLAAFFYKHLELENRYEANLLSKNRKRRSTTSAFFPLSGSNFKFCPANLIVNKIVTP